MEVQPDMEDEERPTAASESEYSSEAEASDEEQLDDPELAQARHVNDERLKRRWESIFDKYEQDFSWTGDEIDLETGEIVVDNGHLRTMLHEVDIGQGASRQFVRAFAENLERDSELDVSVDDVQSEGDVLDPDVDSDRGIAAMGDFSTPELEGDSATSFTETDDIPIDPVLLRMDDGMAQKASVVAPTILDPDAVASVSTSVHLAHYAPTKQDSKSLGGSFNIMEVPDIQKTMLALQSAGNEVDSDAIQALGVDIANHLAQLICSKDNSCRKKRKERGWEYPELPVDLTLQDPDTPRPKRPQLLSLSSGSKSGAYEPRESLWAPIKHPHQRKKPGTKRSVMQAQQDQHEPGFAIPRDGSAIVRIDSELDVQVVAESQDSMVVPLMKSCYHCGIKATPTWRRGPGGELCNACGMYLYRYGLMKPLRALWLSDPEDGDDESQVRTRETPTVTGNGIKNSRFSPEEDALLIKLKEIDLRQWSDIGRHFPSRTNFAVQCRYSKKLLNVESEGRRMLLEQGFDFNNPTKRRDGFSEAEDELIVQLREESEMPFVDIAQGHFIDKTPTEIETRYIALINGTASLEHRKSKHRPQGDHLPKNIYHKFSQQEDELLVQLRELEQLTWDEVAGRFPTRTQLSLQKRYVRHLAHRKADALKRGLPWPPPNLCKDSRVIAGSSVGMAQRENREQVHQKAPHYTYTSEEDDLLLRLRNDKGLTWERISRQLPGRTPKSVQKRYLHIMQKLGREPNAVQQRSDAFGRAKDLSEPELQSHELMPISPHDSAQSRESAPPLGPDAHPNTIQGQTCSSAPHCPRPIEAVFQLRTDNAEVNAKLVVQLRDEQKLPWEEIALRFPGHTISSLMQHCSRTLRTTARLKFCPSAPSLSPRLATPTLSVRAPPEGRGPSYNPVGSKIGEARRTVLLDATLRERENSSHETADQLPRNPSSQLQAILGAPLESWSAAISTARTTPHARLRFDTPFVDNQPDNSLSSMADTFKPVRLMNLFTSLLKNGTDELDSCDAEDEDGEGFDLLQLARISPRKPEHVSRLLVSPSPMVHTWPITSREVKSRTTSKIFARPPAEKSTTRTELYSSMALPSPPAALTDAVRKATVGLGSTPPAAMSSPSDLSQRGSRITTTEVHAATACHGKSLMIGRETTSPLGDKPPARERRRIFSPAGEPAHDTAPAPPHTLSISEKVEQKTPKKNTQSRALESKSHGSYSCLTSTPKGDGSLDAASYTTPNRFETHIYPDIAAPQPLPFSPGREDERSVLQELKAVLVLSVVGSAPEQAPVDDDTDCTREIDAAPPSLPPCNHKDVRTIESNPSTAQQLSASDLVESTRQISINGSRVRIAAYLPSPPDFEKTVGLENLPERVSESGTLKGKDLDEGALKTEHLVAKPRNCGESVEGLVIDVPQIAPPASFQSKTLRRGRRRKGETRSSDGSSSSIPTSSQVLETTSDDKTNGSSTTGAGLPTIEHNREQRNDGLAKRKTSRRGARSDREKNCHNGFGLTPNAPAAAPLSTTSSLPPSARSSDLYGEPKSFPPARSTCRAPGSSREQRLLAPQHSDTDRATNKRHTRSQTNSCCPALPLAKGLLAPHSNGKTSSVIAKRATTSLSETQTRAKLKAESSSERTVSTSVPTPAIARVKLAPLALSQERVRRQSSVGVPGSARRVVLVQRAVRAQGDGDGESEDELAL